LDDGFSSFRGGFVSGVTATQAIAIAASIAYGIKAYPATFQPACDAYTSDASNPDRTYFNAFITLDGVLSNTPSVSTSFTTSRDYSTNGVWGAYSEAFWKNITNQPTFADPSKGCDNFIRFFNTSVTEGRFAPVPVVGEVHAQDPIFPGGGQWAGVKGVRFATPFLENNYVACASLKGYSGTGPGD
jgi:hypothetical protein